MNRKNVIVITIDECKASALSTYGNSYVKTEGSEYALRNGIMFENSFTTHPKCVPARTAIFSGRYPHTDGHRTLPGFELAKHEENLITILKNHNYRTALFGKNHTVDDTLVPELFDCYQKSSLKELKESGPKPKLHLDDHMWKAYYRGNWEDSFSGDPMDCRDVDDSIDFLKNIKDDPFLMMVNLRMPHPVYRGMPGFLEEVRKKGVTVPQKEILGNANNTLRWYRESFDVENMRDDETRTIIEAYLSMVSFIDNEVLRIYQAVEELGLKEDTVIIYTSDHGDFAGEHGCFEKFDTMFYDCLVKVPLFMQYPPLLGQNIKMDSMVENVDILPTILDILELPLPSTIHGKSLLPYITGKNQTHKDFAFCEGGVEKAAIETAPDCGSSQMDRVFPTYYLKQKVLNDHPIIMQRSKMIRSREWKLIFRENGEKELYSMTEDPGELHNCYKENKGKALELIEQLLMWEIRTETDRPGIKVLSA